MISFEFLAVPTFLSQFEEDERLSLVVYLPLRVSKECCERDSRRGRDDDATQR